jgi:hypothetical protein
MTANVHRAVLEIDIDSGDQADKAPREVAPQNQLRF